MTGLRQFPSVSFRFHSGRPELHTPLLLMETTSTEEKKQQFRKNSCRDFYVGIENYKISFIIETGKIVWRKLYEKGTHSKIYLRKKTFCELIILT
jgi:hypothetical protein